MNAAVNWSQQLNEIVAEARRLRSDSERASVLLYLYLYKVEHDQQLRAVLDANACSMEDFLESNGLAKPMTYRAFATGFERIGRDEEQAHALGVEGVKRATKVAEDKLSAFVGYSRDWRAIKGGMAPSAETAAKLASQADPHAEVPAATRRLSTIERLNEENRQLRARVRELEAEVKAERAKRERLEKAAAKSKPTKTTARKRGSK